MLKKKELEMISVHGMATLPLSKEKENFLIMMLNQENSIIYIVLMQVYCPQILVRVHRVQLWLFLMKLLIDCPINDDTNR